MKTYLLCLMKSLVTDYAIILNNTTFNIIPNIFNLGRPHVYEAPEHMRAPEKDYSWQGLCKSRNKNIEWPPHTSSEFKKGVLHLTSKFFFI